MAADGNVAVRSPLLGCSSPVRLIAGTLRAEHSRATTSARKETVVFLATTQIEDFDRFLGIFSMRGTEKRQQHGSKGALIFRDPSEEDRAWVILRLARAELAELRVGPRSPTDHEKARPQSAHFAANCGA